jgi:hypothetical protein
MTIWNTLYAMYTVPLFLVKCEWQSQTPYHATISFILACKIEEYLPVGSRHVENVKWNYPVFFCKKLKNFLEKSLETNGEPFISADCFLLSLHSANCFFSSGPNNYASPCWPDFISFPWKYFTLLLTNAETFGSFGTLCRGRPVSQAVRLLSYHRGPSSVPGSSKWGSY